jgi:hypothetical protein
MASTLAATALVPLFQAGSLAGIWRGNDLLQPPAAALPGVASGCMPGCTPSGFAALDAELPGGGWPRGQLTELLLEQPGIGELGLLMPALAATQRTCVWVLPHAGAGICEGIPYAPALEQAGIDPSRHIFVRPASAREGAWALEQSLRAKGLGVVLGWLPRSPGPDADFRILRRLHLLAQRCDAPVFVLRPADVAGAPSPAPLRLALAHDNEHLQVRVLKRRGRPLLEPVALQVHQHRWAPSPGSSPGRKWAQHPDGRRTSLLQRFSSLMGGNPPRWAGAFPD